MIFAEPDLEDLASLVPYFETEGSGHRLAALNVLPVEAVGVLKCIVLVHERRQWENQKVAL